jgi:hypothetical protein
MDARARIALGVAGGYVLGRTRKLKLAMTLGGVVAGRKLGAAGMLGKGMDVVTSSPEFARLRKQVGGVGRAAAVSAATNSLSRVTERIESGSARSSDHDCDDAPERDEEAARRRPRTGSTGSSGRPRSAGTHRPRSAKKATAKKVTGKKAPARRAAAKSAASGTAKKAPQRRTSSGTARRRGDRRG